MRRVNEQAGLINVEAGQPITVRLAAGAAGPHQARYVLRVRFVDDTGLFELRVSGQRRVCTVNPTPFQPSATFQPIQCARGLGMTAIACREVSELAQDAARVP